MEANDRVLTDEEQARKIRALDKAWQDQWDADFRAMMNDPKFRRFLAVFFKRYPPFKEDGFVPNGSDNYFRDGMTEPPKWILDQIVVICGPEPYTKMLTEWRLDVLGRKKKQQEEEANGRPRNAD